jgi:hypothetical protein
MPQRQPGRRYNERQTGKGRQPSVQVRSDWDVIKELDFQQLNKLKLPNIEPGKDMLVVTINLKCLTLKLF